MKAFLKSSLLIFSISGAIAQPKAFNGKFWKIFEPNVAIEKVATGFIFTEGPVWNPSGFLLFSDIPANTIYKLQNKETSVYKQPSYNSNGLTYTPNLNLIVCEQKTKQVVEVTSEKTFNVLASDFEGKTFNSPNDVVIRKSGGIYFTDPPYGHFNYFSDVKPELSFTGVYFTQNGKTILIDSTLKRANGICLSPNEKTLYVAQSEFDWLWKAYKLDKEGKVKSSKILYKGSAITGNPDGVKVDVDGNIYCTANHGIVVFNKKGKLLGEIRLPENTSNLTWGDSDLKTLYITAASSVYKIKTKKKGYLSYIK